MNKEHRLEFNMSGTGAGTAPLFKISIASLFIIKMTKRVQIFSFSFKKIIFISLIHFNICLVMIFWKIHIWLLFRPSVNKGS